MLKGTGALWAARKGGTELLEAAARGIRRGLDEATDRLPLQWSPNPGSNLGNLRLKRGAGSAQTKGRSARRARSVTDEQARDFVSGLPRRRTPTKGPANQFEIRQTGEFNFKVSGGGSTFEIDGFRGVVILDAKHAGNQLRSPFIPGSKIDPRIRKLILDQQRDELRRVRKILEDPSNPFRRLEIITNNRDAKRLFESLMRQEGVHGHVVIRK